MKTMDLFKRVLILGLIVIITYVVIVQWVIPEFFPAM